jgi:hypothetical protein
MNSGTTTVNSGRAGLSAALVYRFDDGRWDIESYYGLMSHRHSLKDSL